jgi:dihydroorotase
MRRLARFVALCLLFLLLAGPHPRSLSLGGALRALHSVASLGPQALSLVPVVTAQQPTSAPPPKYDLLLRGGHVIDARNKISAVRDIAIANGKIAAVDAKLNPADALKTVDVTGLYLTPGLVDIHTHNYTGTGERNSYAGDNSLPPDGFTFRVGVTTVADAGCAGWRNFEDFKQRIIDRSKTRVLAFINIVGHGMGEGPVEQNREDMDAEPTVAMARKHKDIIVGVKSAHYNGADWKPYEQAEIAGRTLDLPVMVDFGGNVRAGRTLGELFTKHFRPGDIYTHMYGGVRGEQDANTKGPSQAFIDGRKKGVILDVGHGGGSFRWSAAIPMMKAGFIPDSISTDLHASSMNAGMKNMLDVMSKFLLMGESLDDVIKQSTWNPAKEIHVDDRVGSLSVGSPADVAVIRLDQGRFGFLDQLGVKVEGTQRLACEVTLVNGKIEYDLNGRGSETFKN